MTHRLLPVVLAGAVLAADLLPAAEPLKPTSVWKAAGPITIDGKLDEPAWQQAAPIAVQYVWGKVGQRAAEPRMTAKYTWDDHYLHIGYETFDKNLVARGSGEKKGPKGNQQEGALIAYPTDKVDVVEFFVSFGDERVFWEVHHNALNQFNDILCSVADDKAAIAKSTLFRFGIHFGTGEVLQDDADTGRRRAMAVQLKPKTDGKPSTVNDPSDVDTGYVGEVRLPWLGLGAPLDRETFVAVEKDGKKVNVHGPWKMAGQTLLILAVNQNADLPEHYFHSSPTKPGGWFHKGADLWPRYILAEKKE